MAFFKGPEDPDHLLSFNYKTASKVKADKPQTGKMDWMGTAMGINDFTGYSKNI